MPLVKKEWGCSELSLKTHTQPSDKVEVIKWFMDLNTQTFGPEYATDQTPIESPQRLYTNMVHFTIKAFKFDKIFIYKLLHTIKNA